jgi:hypothetical protein
VTNFLQGSKLKTKDDLIDLLNEIEELYNAVTPDNTLLQDKISNMVSESVYDPIPGLQFKVNLDLQTKVIDSYSFIVKPDLVAFRGSKRFTEEDMVNLINFLKDFFDIV